MFKSEGPADQCQVLS